MNILTLLINVRTKILNSMPDTWDAFFEKVTYILVGTLIIYLSIIGFFTLLLTISLALSIDNIVFLILIGFLLVISYFIGKSFLSTLK